MFFGRVKLVERMERVLQQDVVGALELLLVLGTELHTRDAAH